jgi:hypothetical protein
MIKRKINTRTRAEVSWPRLFEGVKPNEVELTEAVRLANTLVRDGWTQSRMLRVASLYGDQAPMRLACEFHHIRGFGEASHRRIVRRYPELGLPAFWEVKKLCQGRHPGKTHGVDYGIPYDEDGTGTGR